MRTAGVDIGGTSIKAGIFEDGKLLHKTKTRTPFGDPDAVCAAISQMLEEFDPDIVGVGSAGSVQPNVGTVSASNLGWEGVPLRDILIKKLQKPVYVDNDAQAALMAEWQNGVCKDAECALYLTLGTGIGGAMIIGGRPYRGKNHLGAEFGHMIIHPDGPRCACGRRGCLEYYASATGLQRISGNRPAHIVLREAKAGNPKALASLDRYIRELCIGLNNLIMLFDPEVIVLGGGVSGAGDFLAEKCTKELARIFSETTDPLLCAVRVAKYQNEAGIIGAALLAEAYLDSK